jgi:hypothetical protein
MEEVRQRPHEPRPRRKVGGSDDLHRPLDLPSNPAVAIALGRGPAYPVGRPPAVRGQAAPGATVLGFEGNQIPPAPQALRPASLRGSKGQCLLAQDALGSGPEVRRADPHPWWRDRSAASALVCGAFRNGEQIAAASSRASHACRAVKVLALWRVGHDLARPWLLCTPGRWNDIQRGDRFRGETLNDVTRLDRSRTLVEGRRRRRG